MSTNGPLAHTRYKRDMGYRHTTKPARAPTGGYPLCDAFAAEVVKRDCAEHQLRVLLDALEFGHDNDSDTEDK